MTRLLWLVLLAACGAPSASSPPPSTAGTEAVVEPLPEALGAAPEGGRLPRDVTPLHYALDLEIVPERDGFSGTTAIRVRLDAPRSVIWMHGRSLEVTS